MSARSRSLLLIPALAILSLTLTACAGGGSSAETEPDPRVSETASTESIGGCPEGYPDAVQADLRRLAQLDEGFDTVEGDPSDLGVPALEDVGIRCVVGAEMGPTGTRWHGFALDEAGTREAIDEALLSAGFEKVGDTNYVDAAGDRSVLVSRQPASEFFADMTDELELSDELSSASLIVVMTQ